MKTGKFQQYIELTGNKLIGQRAGRIIKQAIMLSQDRMRSLDMKINQAEDELEAMLDFGPRTRDSLTLGAFKADEFLDKYHRLSFEIRLDKIELEHMKQTHRELFGDGSIQVEVKGDEDETEE